MVVSTPTFATVRLPVAAWRIPVVIWTRIAGPKSTALAIALTDCSHPKNRFKRSSFLNVNERRFFGVGH